MTANQNNQAGLDSRLKEMEEENELLLLQLHQVQEELEHYYLRNRELEKTQPSGTVDGVPHVQGWVDDYLPEVLAENHRLRAMVEAQRKLHQLETQNALNARLGNILIEAADKGALLSVPGKLAKIWRESKRNTPPKLLGDNSFDKVIAAYNAGGFGAVERLLDHASGWPVVQANAYTALARHVMKTDRTSAAEAARRAHTLDPKPYRLKWLAFRLHEAGDVIEAEAMLSVLPSEISFSDSELRQASQLRYEAKYVRFREARQSLRSATPEAESQQTAAANLLFV